MKIAAFFDLDGTLLPSPSLERRFFWFALMRRQLRIRGALNWLRESFVQTAAAFHCCATANLARNDGNKYWTAGIAENFCSEWARRESHSLGFFAAALDRVEWHIAQQHKVFVISGSLAPIIRGAAEFNPSFAKFEICATELESAAGRWTGGTFGAAVCGPEKARAAARLAARHEINLGVSYAYGNSSADRWLLACVGHPFAVNPDGGLAHLADMYRWPVLKWKDFKSTDGGVATLCPWSRAPHPILRELEERKLPWA